eukprot:TRINITY_DN549_c0_g1_i2.p1 TRINITY_DN549_c0_g1~~TRINITY_DN549_c0_g1_i2.p1  ORF type:complete len:177 (+),score=33.17 TRINITY_DN549_c0_g1_i2:44-574(+)
MEPAPTTSKRSKREKKNKILIVVDNGGNRSTHAAFNLCMKAYKPERDEIFLINVYTSWDYLNEEKNAGKLALSQYERLCQAENIPVTVRQIEADDPNEELVDIITDLEIDTVYIGDMSFTNVANSDNIVFSFFSNVKRYFTGTTAEYLKEHVNSTTKIIVATEHYIDKTVPFAFDN